MKQIRPFSDRRHDAYCTYCGQPPDTKDHVPSKILLDCPFPENLPVVPCCKKCNESLSLDEAYVASLIECVLCGSTEIQELKREKIRNYLAKNEKLLQRLTAAMVVSEGKIEFRYERERIYNTLLKLAKGHLKYETSEPVIGDPADFWFKPLAFLEHDEVKAFNADRPQSILPEVGSRAMQYMVLNQSGTVSTWQIVQPDIYRYSVSLSGGSVSVRLIIREYLASEFIW